MEPLLVNHTVVTSELRIGEDRVMNILNLVKITYWLRLRNPFTPV